MVRKVLYDEYGNSIYTSGLKVIDNQKKEPKCCKSSNRKWHYKLYEPATPKSS